MRLKQIKLAGFKSFVDPTKIPFLKPLTGIIGPNGCGKSNTIDAVRWVLGESNAKHLRGDAMTDVIFNGSSARRPVSVASVELVFENLDGRLGGQYASYQEISVKRQVNRDAESSYFLNGQKCRRKDITDLFMGTGLGPRSYAIIEQGTISRLIESKPQELRVFIEEAAGISRYKERRRDTENRIRHTRENLERLGDIRLELGKQLDKLSSQSKSAQRYREFKQEERQTQAQLLVMRYQELMDRAGELTADINAKELEQQKLLAAKAAAENNSTKEKLRVDELDRQEQELVQAFFQTGTQVARLEQQQAHEEQKDAGLKASLDKIASQRQSLALALAGFEAKIQQLNSQREPVAAEQQVLTEAVEELTERLALLEEDKDSLDAQLNASRQRQSELQLQHAQCKGKLEQTEQLQQLKTEQLNELKQIQSEQVNDESLQALKVNLDTLARVREQALTELESLRDKLAQQHAKRDHIDAEMGRIRSELSGNESRQEFIGQWLDKAAGETGQTRLWQVLDVKPGWEDAVDLLLQGWLDTQVIGDTPDSESSPDIEGWQRHYGTKSGVFSAPVNLMPWLEGVIWCETLSEARAKLATLKDNERIVTADGYLLGLGFVLSKNSGDSELALQNELTSLQHAREPLLKASGDISLEARQLKDAIELLTNQLDDARHNLEQHTLALARAEHQWQTELDAREKAARDLASRSDKTARLQQDIARLEAEVELLNEQFTALDNHLIKLGDELNLQSGKQLEASIRVRDLRGQLSDKQNQLQALTSQAGLLETQLALTTQEQRQASERLTELALSEQELKQQRTDNPQPDQTQVDTVQQELRLQMARHSQLQQQLEQIRAEQTSWQAQLEASLLMQKQEVGKIETLTQSMAELKLKREGLKGQADSQLQLLREAEIKLDEVSGTLPEGAATELWQQKLDSLRARISRLGPINLAAIEEFEQQSERKQYLDNQNNDLTQALESLEEAIRKIDRETRTRFRATFEQINADLGSLFPKVFGGGSAYLALTDDDLLETGVTIMARPPGKKNSTIHLLSGGEKALTALSLVFAIFRLNPAPFCMLDEVDAPLDDANVERFCRLLKEMSQSVQFIYISHNKITMEMADQLIGVTMHEPGVSRIVAVDLEEAVAMADAG